MDDNVRSWNNENITFLFYIIQRIRIKYCYKLIVNKIKTKTLNAMGLVICESNLTRFLDPLRLNIERFTNGSLLTFDGKVIDSKLITQEFKSDKFFHVRTAANSTSGVDPHISPEETFSKIHRISKATGLPENT